jgi:hypothetical protein
MAVYLFLMEEADRKLKASISIFVGKSGLLWEIMVNW